MYDIVEMVSIWFIALRWALYSTVLILPAAICKFPSFCVLVLYLRDFWLQIYSYLFIFFSFTHIGFLNSFFVLEFKFYLALIFLKTCTPCIPEWSTLIDTSSNRETMIFFFFDWSFIIFVFRNWQKILPMFSNASSSKYGSYHSWMIMVQ